VPSVLRGMGWLGAGCLGRMIGFPVAERFLWGGQRGTLWDIWDMGGPIYLHAKQAFLEP